MGEVTMYKCDNMDMPKLTCPHGVDTTKVCVACVAQMNVNTLLTADLADLRALDADVLAALAQRLRPFLAERIVPEHEVVIDYTNYRGERRKRRIQPVPNTLRFTETPHHKPAQWVLNAYDCEREDRPQRTFALKDIHSWEVP